MLPVTEVLDLKKFHMYFQSELRKINIHFNRVKVQTKNMHMHMHIHEYIHA